MKGAILGDDMGLGKTVQLRGINRGRKHSSLYQHFIKHKGAIVGGDMGLGFVKNFASSPFRCGGGVVLDMV